jgi:hypothetical protein
MCKLATGRRRVPDYRLETETQREFKDPKLKSIQYLKHIEQNRYGRYAYTPKQTAARGTCKLYIIEIHVYISNFVSLVPTFDGKAYAEVIPRFQLPKMPF